MKKPPKKLRDMVDSLGYIQAQISELRLKEAEYKAKLTETCLEEVDGALYKCSISRFYRKRIDYSGLIESLAVPPKTLAKFTIAEPQVRISLSSRN